ncbi:MAG: hypothetical protein E6J08_09445, partial [Chloroflexi bacterium]
KTNPNLLVDQAAQNNLLFLYDTDNPASYNDLALSANATNFGQGQIFFDPTPFGPADANHVVAPLNQFRVTGFGMGANRCIGGPSQAAAGVDDNSCTGPVGASEPGGVTFKGIQNLEIDMGPGANRFTILDTPAGALTRVNTGAGKDLVDVKKISGHTFVNTGAGTDTVRVHNDLNQLSQIAGLLTLSGDSPQANVVTLANGSPAQGTAVDAVDAIQQVTVDATGGKYKLTYAPQPLGLTAAWGVDAGGLAAGTYYYVVTATTPLGETTASPETFVTVGGSARVQLAWSPVPFATGYTVYRGTSAGQENASYAAASPSFTDQGDSPTGVGVTPPTTNNAARSATIQYNASASDVATALAGLTLLGGLTNLVTNLDVLQAGNVYRIHFQGDLKATAIPILLTDPTLLTNGADLGDTLNVFDSGASTPDSALLTSSSLTGLDMPVSNTTQQLVLDATSGQFTLDYSFPNLIAIAALNGSLGAGTHYYRVTAVTSAGETIGSAETSVVTLNNGSVNLSWTRVPGALTYNIYRGAAAGAENARFSSSITTFTDLGMPGASATPPVTTVGKQSAGSLSSTISAADLQAALEALTAIGPGNVVVSKNDDVYVLRFQGLLSDSPVMQLVAHAGVASAGGLSKAVEPLGGAPTISTVDGSAVVTTRPAGPWMPATNQVQILTVNAIGGSYTLSFQVNGVQFQTGSIPFDAGAEQLRQAIQNAVAAGETSDPNQQLYFKDAVDVTVDRYPSGNWYADQHLDFYVLNFQGVLRKFNGGPGLSPLVVAPDATMLGSGGTATVATRMDGINYYGFETVNISTGTESEVFNVQGTTPGSNGFTGVASTNIVTNPAGAAGNDRVFISSNADLDQTSWGVVDFLTGNMDDVRGALNLDLGAGRHRLFMSDEGSSDPDNVVITRNNPGVAGLDSMAEIWVTGLAPAGISYKAANPSGNFYDGVAYWTGSGGDTVLIDGTHDRPAIVNGQATARTTTMLNTGLGDDNVTVKLKAGLDGFFVLNTSGGLSTGDPVTHNLPGSATDNDTVDASASSLPLVIFGGFGADSIKGGSGNDIIAGDFARVQYTDYAGNLIAQFGYGGRGDIVGDLVNQPVVDPRWVYSFVLDLSVGGSDTIYGNDGEDIVIGGMGNNRIDGGRGDDLLFGGNAQLFRRDVNPYLVVDISNPRFQTLIGTQMYSTSGSNLGQALNDGVWRNYRDSNGMYAPDWAEYVIKTLYQSTDPTDPSYAPPASIGNNYMAGGPSDDMLFGGPGNDVMQGDGSIDYAPHALLGDGTVDNSTTCTGVGGYRDATNTLHLCPSVDNYGQIAHPNDPTYADGSDYMEGGAGQDILFGNQGQDDLVGGNSDMFSRITPAERSDAPNLIFGGSGTAIARNDLGDTSLNGHAHDSDAIVANNGDIVRVVGINGTPQLGTDGKSQVGFLTFKYDDFGTERIVPRSVSLLDYTAGGPDLLGQAGPVVSGTQAANHLGDIGATILANGQAQGSEIHAENGDDFIDGGPGNDVLFGDGQNDTMIGGYGNDWMSGGTGDDGLLGDDGRLFLSRDGLASGEPLYGIAPIATPSQLITTPGNMQQALINVSLELKYTALLTPDNLDPTHAAPYTLMPRPLYASDIMYGGLGNDALHGGAGDDAMSGAEAPLVSYTNNYKPDGTQINASLIESDFAHPFNPGNVLGYSPTTTKFAQYDANDPLRKILLTANGSLSKTGSGSNWLLNFDANEGPVDTMWIQGQTTYGGVPTDGNDTMFGDLGNDWLVGGTGRDKMYGGWGDDLLNADDNLDTPCAPTGTATTGCGLNTTTDTNPSYEDLAFGGAGRDVLISNTGGDRLIDWIGEFNSYLTPYAPFGMASVSRTLQPQLPEFLYALSQSDGADPTLAARYASDPTRNGEPFGELGLLRQTDAAIADNRGKPRDPQAGNTPGGKRDVLRTSGTLPINSPGTSSDPPVGASRLVSAPARVDNNGQTAVPTVVSGPAGSAVTYVVSDGTTSVSGTGTVGSDGMLPVVLDLSKLSDSVLTTTVTTTGASPLSTTLIKNTAPPGAPGLSTLAYVNLAAQAATIFTIAGLAGLFVSMTVYDGTNWQDGFGYLDSTGRLSLTLDLSRLADGPLTATVTMM